MATIKYFQSTNGIGTAKATLTLTSVSGPACLATQWELENVPVWVGCDDAADAVKVETADSSDSYVSWTDATGSIGGAKAIEGLAKVG